MYLDDKQENILNNLLTVVDQEESETIKGYFGLKNIGKSAGGNLYNMLEDILIKYGYGQYTRLQGYGNVQGENP